MSIFFTCLGLDVTTANSIKAELRDIASSVPDHWNKVKTTMNCVT